MLPLAVVTGQHLPNRTYPIGSIPREHTFALLKDTAFVRKALQTPGRGTLFDMSLAQSSVPCDARIASP